MENTGNFDKCSCDDPEIEETEFCDVTFSKDKRSKINIFGLCRDKSLPFTAKRNKKSNASTSSSSKNITKKSPKWGIKFNCTKKENKTAFNSGNQNCCRCTCYKHTNENELPLAPSSSEFTEEHERLTGQASSSNNTYNDNEMDVVDHSLNHEETSSARNLYSVVQNSLQVNSIPNLIVTAPLSNLQW